MKQFLYLVQSRKEFLENHKVLESDNSDCIILTFQEKVGEENFLYLPQSLWEEGRNALIEHARRLPQRYEYYVLLDDDIQFLQGRGSFREFEREVLRSKPDFTTPVYANKRFAFEFAKLTAKFFRVTQAIQLDCCFVCFSRNLFFSPLLPYETVQNSFAKYRGSWSTSYFFWLRLYRLYANAKSKRPRIFVLNRLVIQNALNKVAYTKVNFFSLLKTLWRHGISQYSFNVRTISSIPLFITTEILYNYCMLLFARMPDRIPILRKIVSYSLVCILWMLFVCAQPFLFVTNLLVHKRMLGTYMQVNRVRKG